MDNDWILASKLYCHRCQDLRSRCTNLVRNVLASDECDMRNTGMSCQIVSTFRKANDVLHEHGAVIARVEGSSYELEKVRCTPTSLLARLDHNSVARKKSGNHW